MTHNAAQRETEEAYARARAAVADADPDALDGDALTAAHVAVEDELADMRDRDMYLMGPRNGLVIHDKDGSPNGGIRIGTRDALRIGIAAYLAALAHKEDPR